MLARLFWFAAVLLVVAACGGDSEPGAADTDDGGGESVDLDVPDDGEFLVGGDLDLPDWFPPGFEFADDFAITVVFVDDATMGLQAETDQPIDGTHASAVDALSNAGYELLTDDGNFAVFIRDGVGRVRVRTSQSLDGSSTSFTVDIDRWTDEQLEELRVLTAPEVTTAGSAVAEVDGQSRQVDGECIIQGRRYLFVADDASMSASVDGFADPPNVYADITTEDGTLYYMDVDADRDYEIDSAEPPVSFSVSGDMVELNAEGPEFDATVEVTCEA